MKKLVKLTILILVLSCFFTISATASEITPYASNYFGSYRTYLVDVSDSEFQVWFTVDAVRGMDKLGVSSIEIERSSDGVNWTPVKTYTKESYSNLVANNTSFHSSYVTYSEASSAYQYRAYVDFYAKSGTGTGYYGAYAY